MTDDCQWIDSCCIDKTSSAELSEAINSMFEWYRRAEVCYAYLSDVSGSSLYFAGLERSFSQSAWFERGWTLQELLAPQWVEFYDYDWIELGTKSSLAPLITSITGITHLFNHEEACIAQKMSWASKRQTTRIEDRAYCLLGLFGVHMPPLYGEGKNAFYRLQVEIISQSDDESIFAWFDESNNQKGLLASSPEQFEKSGGITRATFDAKRQPYSMTNQGLRLELAMRETTSVMQEKVLSGRLKRIIPPIGSERNFLAPLNCLMPQPDNDSYSVPNDSRRFVWLPLCKSKASTSNEARSWFRRGNLSVSNDSLASNTYDLTKMVIYVQTETPTSAYSRPQTVIARLPKEGFPFKAVEKLKMDGDTMWSRDPAGEHMLSFFYKKDEVAALVFQDSMSARFAIVLGSTDFTFWTNILVDDTELAQLSKLSPEELPTLLVQPDGSAGLGDRIIHQLEDGRVVTASTRKELRAASYRLVVEIDVSKPARFLPQTIQFQPFRRGGLDQSGFFEQQQGSR